MGQRRDARLLPAGTLCASCKYLSAYCITRHDNVRPRLRTLPPPPPPSPPLPAEPLLLLSYSYLPSYPPRSYPLSLPAVEIIFTTHPCNVLIDGPCCFVCDRTSQRLPSLPRYPQIRFLFVQALVHLFFWTLVGCHGTVLVRKIAEFGVDVGGRLQDLWGCDFVFNLVVFIPCVVARWLSRMHG